MLWVIRLAVGSNVVVVIGRNRFDGHIATVNPLSKEVCPFLCPIASRRSSRLRSGLKCDVHIMYAAKVGVLRIKNGPLLYGARKYDLFVERDGVLYRRAVVLGDSNYEYVEVESGLEVGERVVTSDMRSYLGKTKIKMKKGQKSVPLTIQATLIRVYIKQAWQAVRQNRFFSFIYVVGTASSIMVMILSIGYLIKTKVITAGCIVTGCST